MCEFFRKQDDPIYTPAHGPNTVSPMNRNLYAIMGEENIFKMLEDFYLELGKSDIKQMFPDDLVEPLRNLPPSSLVSWVGHLYTLKDTAHQE